MEPQVGCCFFCKLWKEFIPQRGSNVNPEWEPTHPLPICGRCMLNFSCDRNTTKPKAERERERAWDRSEWALVAPEGFSAICHCARTIRPVTDSRTERLQVNCDRLLGVCVCLVRGRGRLHQRICILSLRMPVAVSLHPPPPCTGTRVWGACTPLIKRDAGRDVAKGIA